MKFWKGQNISGTGKSRNRRFYAKQTTQWLFELKQLIHRDQYITGLFANTLQYICRSSEEGKTRVLEIFLDLLII